MKSVCLNRVLKHYLYLFPADWGMKVTPFTFFFLSKAFLLFLIENESAKVLGKVWEQLGALQFVVELWLFIWHHRINYFTPAQSRTTTSHSLLCFSWVFFCSQGWNHVGSFASCLFSPFNWSYTLNIFPLSPSSYSSLLMTALHSTPSHPQAAPNKHF